MSAQDLVDYLQCNFESGIFEDWKRAVGAGDEAYECAGSPRELVEYIKIDMRESNIVTYAYYMMGPTRIGLFKEFGFDHENLEANMQESWLAYLDVRVDQKRNSIEQGVR